MAGELGLTSVAPQRGWEALKAIGRSIQAPRASGRARPSPVPLALCHGLRITGHRRNLLVSFRLHIKPASAG